MKLALDPKNLLPAALAAATVPVWIAAAMFPPRVIRGIEAMAVVHPTTRAGFFAQVLGEAEGGRSTGAWIAAALFAAVAVAAGVIAWLQRAKDDRRLRALTALIPVALASLCVAQALGAGALERAYAAAASSNAEERALLVEEGAQGFLRADRLAGEAIAFVAVAVLVWFVVALLGNARKQAISMATGLVVAVGAFSLDRMAARGAWANADQIYGALAADSSGWPAPAVAAFTPEVLREALRVPSGGRASQAEWAAFEQQLRAAAAHRIESLDLVVPPDLSGGDVRAVANAARAAGVETLRFAVRDPNVLPPEAARARELAPLVKAAQLVRPLEVMLLTPELQARLPAGVETFAVPSAGKEPPAGDALVVTFADDAKAIELLQVLARPRRATLLRVDAP